MNVEYPHSPHSLPIPRDTSSASPMAFTENRCQFIFRGATVKNELTPIFAAG
jgi:hypothetical protein